MTIDRTRRLISTGSEENANLLLAAGWKLLLIADRKQDTHQWLVYQFGWQRDEDPVDVTFTGVEPWPDPF